MWFFTICLIFCFNLYVAVVDALFLSNVRHCLASVKVRCSFQRFSGRRSTFLSSRRVFVLGPFLLLFVGCCPRSRRPPNQVHWHKTRLSFEFHVSDSKKRTERTQILIRRLWQKRSVLKNSFWAMCIWKNSVSYSDFDAMTSLFFSFIHLL